MAHYHPQQPASKVIHPSIFSNNPQKQSLLQSKTLFLKRSTDRDKRRANGIPGTGQRKVRPSVTKSSRECVYPSSSDGVSRRDIEIPIDFRCVSPSVATPLARGTPYTYTQSYDPALSEKREPPRRLFTLCVYIDTQTDSTPFHCITHALALDRILLYDNLALQPSATV